MGGGDLSFQIVTEQNLQRSMEVPSTPPSIQVLLGQSKQVLVSALGNQLHPAVMVQSLPLSINMDTSTPPPIQVLRGQRK
jgi:hypothetical protein